MVGPDHEGLVVSFPSPNIFHIELFLETPPLNPPAPCAFFPDRRIQINFVHFPVHRLTKDVVGISPALNLVQ